MVIGTGRAHDPACGAFQRRETRKGERGQVPRVSAVNDYGVAAEASLKLKR